MSESTTKSSADLPPSSEGPGHDTDPVRRRLLRAAAAAPLMATLPSGAAYANVSAFQCVVSSRLESEGTPPGPPVMSQTALDTWVRQSVKTRDFRSTQNGPSESKQGWLLGSTWYDKDGNTFVAGPDTGCDPITQWCPISPLRDEYVLIVYQPVPDGSNPTSVNLIGVYPQYSIPIDRPSQVGNIGLAATCMCSVAPNTNPNTSLYCLH
jgi:hypothetical protein